MLGDFDTHTYTALLRKEMCKDTPYDMDCFADRNVQKNVPGHPYDVVGLILVQCVAVCGSVWQCVAH